MKFLVVCSIFLFGGIRSPKEKPRSSRFGAFSHSDADMERTKPKNAGWRSFRFGFVSDKKKPDEEEHRHTPETCKQEKCGCGCSVTVVDVEMLDKQ